MNTADLPGHLRRLVRRVVRMLAPTGRTRPTAPAATGSEVAPAGSNAAVTASPVSIARPLAAPVGADPLEVRAAVAATRRLSALLEPEWQQTRLERGTWREALEVSDLVLLQVTGGQVAGWDGADRQLDRLVTSATGLGVPVAVWVTSGPVPDRDWLRAATVIGAATEALREQVRAVLQDPVREVHLWEAAAQPRTCGQARQDATTTRRAQRALVVLDGFAHLSDDRHLTEVVAPALAKLPADETPVLRIDGKSTLVIAPPLLHERVVAHGPWDAIGGALADARVLLDLGDSAASTPWTSLAAAMAGTPLVGTTGLGRALPADVDALVPRVDEQQALRSELVARMRQEELVAREGLRLRRTVLAGHTAGHRVAAILDAAGRPAPTADRSVSAIVPTNRVHELDNVLANLGRQSHADTELVLVLHGLADHPEVDEADLHSRATAAGVARLKIVHADAALTLGACMNLGVEHADGRYVAKMDDDNFYGEHYLADLVDAFSFTDAGIVGKWCHYVWLRSSGAVVLRYPDSEQRYERRIQGGSMLFDGDVVRRIRFSDIPRAVDSDILDRSLAEGVRVWSGDRYNYVSVRGTDRTTHTWTVADSTFMTATGRLLFHGDPREHVSV